VHQLPIRMLDIQRLNVTYGGIAAVKDISLQVGQGELVCLIGANGAGKSSTLKAITGIQASQGEITFQGQSIQGKGTWTLPAQGLVMVPEGRGIFTRMGIAENLQMGAFARTDPSAAIAQDMGEVYELFPRLKERLGQLAGTLSGGEQQMLAIGRALMARPKLLLLDEPSMGLAPLMVDKIFEVIRSIHQRGTAVLLVEQNASRALHLASRGYVLESGKIMVQGDAKTLLANPQVRTAYLGEIAT
jgi:branched-chain amino acid transport system ATP-binding protein